MFKKIYFIQDDQLFCGYMDRSIGHPNRQISQRLTMCSFDMFNFYESVIQDLSR